MKNSIIIIDWAGNILFEGNCEHKRVDEILDANRCSCDHEGECDECNGTGYKGDLEVHWKDPNDTRNVYEWINY
jgi:hypothetical protein